MPDELAMKFKDLQRRAAWGGDPRVASEEIEQLLSEMKDWETKAKKRGPV